MATKIGCRDLVYAVMQTEDSPTAAPVYGAVKKAPGVMSINVNPNASQDTLFADDGPMETATTLGKIEVEIKKNELTVENKVDLLGHAVDADGGVIYGDSDVPPFVAVGFKSLKSNGKYRNVWLYKGKFIDPEDQNETKGDSINFQSETVKGQFVRLNHKITVGNRKICPWKYEIDEDNPNANESAVSTFFNTVKIPG